jgi:hypothetical protein
LCGLAALAIQLLQSLSQSGQKKFVRLQRVLAQLRITRAVGVRGTAGIAKTPRASSGLVSALFATQLLAVL